MNPIDPFVVVLCLVALALVLAVPMGREPWI